VPRPLLGTEHRAPARRYGTIALLHCEVCFGACPNMTVPAKSSSLGQAIHTLKPDMSSSDSKAALKEANKQAKGDIRETSS